MSQCQQLNEGLLQGDLEYLVDNTLHFDEFNSKMGQAQDIVTLSFKVRDYMPAQDLVNFLESGYDFILDADVSTGEVTDNHRLVFVEMERSNKAYSQIMEMLQDLDHLTGVKPQEWKFKWFKQTDYQPFNEDNFKKTVPDNPELYEQSVNNFKTMKSESEKLKKELGDLKRLSGMTS